MRHVRRGQPRAPYRPARILHALVACLLAAGLGWAALASPAAVGAAGIVVNTLADGFDVAGKTCDTVVIADLPGGGDGKIDLREAVCAANNTAGADTITFGVTGTIALGNPGELSITSDLTITGPGKANLTIDAQDASRVFSISGGAIAISGVTITNGLSLGFVFGLDGGGAILNLGDLTLTDVAVTSSVAQRYQAPSVGGGIFNFNSLRLIRSTVEDNEADLGGGIFNATSLNIADSAISGNRACEGAGIYNGGGISSLGTSTVSGNTSDYLTDCETGGGGIYNDGGLLIATNSTISGNSTVGLGGGLYASSESAAALTFVTITGNKANAQSNVNAVRPAGYGGGGGGIYAEAELRPVAAIPEGTQLLSSIVAGNAAYNGAYADCDGPVSSGGHNLVGQGTGCPTGGSGDLTTTNVAAVLNTTLADNGGPTRTHALLATSPALDQADDALCGSGQIARDQRDVTRPQGTRCDIGAFELVATVALRVQVEGAGTVAVSPAPMSSSGVPTDTTYQYPPGTVVTLTVNYVAATSVLARWTIDGVGPLPYGKGWANPLTITLAADHAAKATIVARPTFSDVPTSHPQYAPITELTARDIVKGYTQQGCDRLQTALPCYGPDDRTERAQAAALLVRLLGLGPEDHGDGGFTDLAGLAPELRRAVGTAAHYGIMQGYGGGKFGPFDRISHLQLAQVIARGFVLQGYWTKAVADDPTIYPNVALSPSERLELVTFVKNAGPLPGFGNGTGRAPLDQPAPRAWTAQFLWQALNGHFGADQPGRGGYVP